MTVDCRYGLVGIASYYFTDGADLRIESFAGKQSFKVCTLSHLVRIALPFDDIPFNVEVGLFVFLFPKFNAIAKRC